MLKWNMTFGFAWILDATFGGDVYFVFEVFSVFEYGSKFRFGGMTAIDVCMVKVV